MTLLAGLLIPGASCQTRVVSVDEGAQSPRSQLAAYRGGNVLGWAQLLDSDSPSARRQAAELLQEGGDDAVPMLSALLRVQNTRICDQVILLLARRGQTAVDIAVAAASSENQTTRRYAARLLWTLAPDSLPALPILVELVRDEHWLVALEATRALSAFGSEGRPATAALVGALGAKQWQLRRAAAGALAALGSVPPHACAPLLAALRDSAAPVRRCAAEALCVLEKSEASAAAVAGLIQALSEDEDVHVRVAAARALGALGASSADSVPALEASVVRDSAVTAEATWAIGQITGTPPSPAGDSRPLEVQRIPDDELPGEEWPMLGGSPSRNAVTRRRLPVSWDITSGDGVLWSERLGNVTYGSPIVANDVVFVGTDNAVPRDPEILGERGVLMAFGARDGRLLWQDVDDPLPRGLENFLLSTTTSSPLVERDRLWYVTAGGRLRCLDFHGFADGENDGPFRDETEALSTTAHADIVWELDLRAELGVFIHEAPNCSVVAAGELLMVCTSNGIDENHANIPAPHAPSFIGVNKRDGKVSWKVEGSSSRVLHGQWSSPCLGDVGGKTLAFFGGGDGRLYALEPATGRELWQFDGNEANAVWRPRNEHPVLPSRNEVIACPVFDQGRVYLTMGHDPNHGKGRGAVHALEVGDRGTDTFRVLWRYVDIGRAIATPIVHGGLLYVADLEGIVHCVDVDTGARVWTHDLMAPVWAALMLADDKVYVGDEDGIITVLGAGRTKRLLARMDMGAPIWTAFAAANDLLYVATARQVYALR